MPELLAALAVGLVIGALFRLLKLPVPVPHGLGGLLGLVGMFVGSEAVAMVVAHLAARG